MTTSIVLSPNVNAHTPAWNIPTYAYINVAPSPAGIGQQVTVGFWLDIVPPTANGVWGDRWQGMKVTVTKPDGTNQTLGPYTTDDTGGTSLIYTPEALGNYTFQMYYPGQTLAGNNPAPGSTSPFIGDFYESAISPPVTLTVQQTPAPTLTGKSASDNLLDATNRINEPILVQHQRELAWSRRKCNFCCYRNVQRLWKLQSIHPCTNYFSHLVDKTHCFRRLTRRRIWFKWHKRFHVRLGV